MITRSTCALRCVWVRGFRLEVLEIAYALGFRRSTVARARQPWDLNRLAGFDKSSHFIVNSREVAGGVRTHTFLKLNCICGLGVFKYCCNAANPLALNKVQMHIPGQYRWLLVIPLFACIFFFHAVTFVKDVGELPVAVASVSIAFEQRSSDSPSDSETKDSPLCHFPCRIALVCSSALPMPPDQAAEMEAAPGRFPPGRYLCPEPGPPKHLPGCSVPCV